MTIDKYVFIPKKEYFVGFASNEYKILSLRAKIRDMMDPYVIEFFSEKDPFLFTIKFHKEGLHCIDEEIDKKLKELINVKK